MSTMIEKSIIWGASHTYNFTPQNRKNACNYE